MSKAILTFIIPCFNSGGLMSRCFDSLKNQTLKNIEIIFVDDGSEDNTKEIIKKFVDIEPRAKLISQENKGITAARLLGLKNSNSKFVTFLDADDYVDANVAEEAYIKFMSDNNIDALLYNFVYLDGEESKTFEVKFNFPLKGEDVISKTIPSWEIYTNGIYKTECALEAYRKINFNSTNSDEVANRLIFENCKKVGKLDSSYYYVHYPSSASKFPSKNYVTRLESAYWLRNYTIKTWAKKVSIDRADIHFINELCSLSLKFRKFECSMPNDVRMKWREELFRYRGYALSILSSAVFKYPSKFFNDYKFLKKIVYILAMPLIIK
ncbi:glycosyltransferase family 2 protein [Oceanisphaera sp. IT1-181]|uniref:glycosyltransferase family 2 protein n=1 Tax=Oceanisphaera sp. IT1-181 TaxID=3081199 RepID=UPI0029C9B822|nr:glycosyltransferase family 2 protein [Oceanisphaera sp. IT1-181]